MKRKRINNLEHNKKKVKLKKFIWYERYWDLLKSYNKTIYDRLKLCSHPYNDNDYVFLKPQFQEKEIPCDYKIATLMKYLWKNKLITFGSNQPNDVMKELGYITFSLQTSDKKCAKTLIEKLLGKDNIFYWTDKKGIVLEELKEKEDSLMENNPNKILFEIYSEFYSISFDEKLFEKIHKILKINPKCEEEIIPGYDTLG
jgi:hypothetical protein